MILLGGFRSSVISLVLYTTLSVFLRDRFLGLVKIAFAAIVVTLGFISLSFTNLELPQPLREPSAFSP
jgi:hypothetical protein